jgi:hypothetical protein
MNLIQRRFFSTAALLLCICSSIQAIEVQDGSSFEPVPTPLTTYYATMPSVPTNPIDSLSSAGTFTSNLGGFNLVISPGPTLAGNAPALAAFNRAAAQWATRISNPITVTINADLAPLGAGIIGSTGSVVLQGSYTTVRNAMVASSLTESDDVIVAFLPTSAQFTAALPAGKSLDGNILLSKANAKALGFTGLDSTPFTPSDASMTFSTNFNFDYDNSNGVTAGQMDFETVAVHEIGHALGFFSTVDEVDQATVTDLTFAPTTLDLFRFNIANSPTTAAGFTTLPRDLTPGVNDVSDFVLPTIGLSGTEFRMSTGVTNGDGRQASHWKADELTSGNYIGMMDPTLSFGVVQQLTEADFRALDLIGYNIAPVPEPSVYALGAVGLGAVYLLRRKRVGAGV